jgi:hypothetical protein
MPDPLHWSKCAKHDAAWFLSFFEAIPESKWCVGWENLRGQKGAVRLCEDPFRMRDLFETLPEVAAINDGQHPDYRQPTPRGRVLAALADVLRRQSEKIS